MDLPLKPTTRIFRAVLFLLSQYWFEVTTNPPQKGGLSSSLPRYRSGDKVFSGLGYTMFYYIIVNGVRLCLRINCLYDMFLCLAPLLPFTLNTYFPGTLTYNPMLTPRIIAGVACMYVCYKIRTHCYSQLGHLFTFVVTIRPEHKIVKSGVYRYVRHASYMAVWVGIVGAVLMHAAPGNAFEAWAPWWLARVVGSWAIWAMVIGGPIPAVYARVRTEEGALEREFGEEWRKYRRETWMFAPFVY